MTTAHVACWTIRERSSSRMGRWSLERSTALKPAASPCRATAWRFAAWLRFFRKRVQQKSIKKKKKHPHPHHTKKDVFKWNQKSAHGHMLKLRSVKKTWSYTAPLWSYTSQAPLWSHQRWRPPNGLDVDSMLPPGKEAKEQRTVYTHVYSL